MENADTVYCELCSLPHDPGTLRCDDCDHQLGTTPNWGALEQEVPRLRMKIAFGLLTAAVMVGANLVAFEGSGYVVVAIAPVAWIIQNGYRYSILTKRLARRGRR